MENLMTPEMTKILSDLGASVKESETFKKYQAAVDTYARSEELNRMVFEYNTHQTAITEEYKKPEIDQSVIAAITGRIDELYRQITENADYKAFLEAQGEYEKYMQAIYAELDYFITGKRSCSHDCSSCGGCH